MNDQAIETRAIDESIRHGLDAVTRAEGMLASLWYDVTGYGPEEGAVAQPTPAGLQLSADLLAGRVESLVRELQRLHARITAPNVKSLGQSAAQANSATRAYG